MVDASGRINVTSGMLEQVDNARSTRAVYQHAVFRRPVRLIQLARCLSAPLCGQERSCADSDSCSRCLLPANERNNVFIVVEHQTMASCAVVPFSLTLALSNIPTPGYGVGFPPGNRGSRC